MKVTLLRQYLGILICVHLWLSRTTSSQPSLDPNEIRLERDICPPPEVILPCRCAANGDEIQIWCSHSDLTRVLIGLKAVAQMNRPIDELILENNNLLSLPGRVFAPLKVMRLMLRHNSLERLSSGWLMDLEDHLVEVYMVENNLRSIPFDSLSGLHKLEAVTIQSENLKHIPDFSNLPKLRYINIQSSSLIELPPQAFQNLMSMETLMVTGSVKLNRLEAGLLHDLPRLQTINLSDNGITSIHLRAFSRLPQLNSLDLSRNNLTDVIMVGRAVKDLRHLQILKLNTNRFTLLDVGSFVDFPALNKLYLNHNQIAEIKQGAFHRTPNLRIVHLENNYLTRVHPESFLQASGSGVEILHLQENEIRRTEELRSLLDALPTLKFLDLSFNQLEFIRYGALHGHGSLEQLYLDNNKIRMIDRDAFMAMPALRELRLKNNSLSDLIPTPFWNLPSLKGLDLSENNFQRLEPELLMGLPALRRIDMSSNSIRVISPNTFMATGMLESINMSKNYVETIYPPTFRSLHRLYEVDLSSNNLREFIPGLPSAVERISVYNNKIEALPIKSTRHLDLPNLRMLDLSRNIIQRIAPSSFYSMRKLRILNVAKNELQEIEDGSLVGLDQLESLNLQDNRLRSIHAKGFVSLNNIDDLNVQGNRLDEISEGLFDSASKIRRLDLSKNNIMHIHPNSFRNTRYIQALDLSSNKIRDLPKGLGLFSQLREIDLSLNQLTSLDPEIIRSWQKLEELRVAGNKLMEIHSGLIRSLPDLQYLDISSNELHTMEPGALRDLPQLQEIVLADNRLRELPDRAFEDLPKLEAVHLQENHLSALSAETFFRTPSMVFLNLSTNNIHNLESAGLRSVRSLEVLDLSNNEIRRLSQNPLRRLDWLVELNLDNNRICRVQGEPFAAMPRLRILTMRNNLFESLPESTFRNLRSNIAILDLDGNPLECTCNMMWYRSWMQETDSPFPGPRCGNGKMLRDLPLSRSECESFERNNKLHVPLTNEHGDLFARQSIDGGDRSPCENEPFEQLKSGLPPPEESEYFDQFVDYPLNETDTNSNTHPSSVAPENSYPGKAFNISNTLLNLNQPVRPHHSSEQPFSIFGFPIPSFGQLFGQGRHAGARATSSGASRGRGRVQLYRNDDPELLKLLNKDGAEAGVAGGPLQNSIHSRPLFQTPFQATTKQEGGFVPLLHGEGGFKPMKNISKDEPGNAIHQEEDDDEGEDKYEQVMTLEDLSDKKIADRIEVTTKHSVDALNNEIAQHHTDLYSISSTTDKAIEETLPVDNLSIKEYSNTNPLNQQVEGHKVPNAIADKEPQRNELLSALIAPGAQQGIYKVPPGRSTITKVLTPSVDTTDPPEQHSDDTKPGIHTLSRQSSSTQPPVVQPIPSSDSYSSKSSSPDWYFASYNQTDTPKLFPKRSYSNVSSRPFLSGLLPASGIALLFLIYV